MGLMDRIRKRDSDPRDSRAGADPQAPRNTIISPSLEVPADRRGYSLSPQFDSTAPRSYYPVEQDSIASSSDRRRSITSSYMGTEYTFDYPQPAHPNFPRAEAALPDLSRSQGRLCVAVDFGTVLSGVAYGRSTASSVRPILWPGPNRKVPTSLLYDPMGVLRAWGFGAKSWPLTEGWTRCEMFKLYFDPRARNLLPPLPPRKELSHLVTDYLKLLWGDAKQAMIQDHYTLDDLKSADIWICEAHHATLHDEILKDISLAAIPAIWSVASGEVMREAAFNAGLVEYKDSTGYSGGRDRLHIIEEPEAAAVHCALWNNSSLRVNQVFMVCDAGGGTIDTAIYKFLGSFHEIAELCASSGSSCGSHFLDLAFRNYLENWHRDRNIHLSETNLSHYMHSFTYSQKLQYSGEKEDADYFFFECYDPRFYPPSPEFTDGQLVVRGDIFRTQIFDPVITQVLNILEFQLSKAGRAVHALLLVGDLRTFGPHIAHILTPQDADIATCLGAAKSGIERGLVRRALTSPTIIAAKSYIISAELPATVEDRRLQGAYIKRNHLNVEICSTRYLVTKGAVLKKGDPVLKPCRKFCGGPRDYTFPAHFYCSERAERESYINGGDLAFLKTWEIELKDIPSFRSYVRHPHPGGLEIDFALGIEIDSVCGSPRQPREFTDLAILHSGTGSLVLRRAKARRDRFGIIHLIRLSISFTLCRALGDAASNGASSLQLRD
ncbi:hypothetical protein BS47DRAFT_1400430 [Hydnum rufescens UP504]|uniref:Uncharacterized protein n=1 Tax=Hydnum rufescens UP504 TaxID=1448309 RepID=A0A9P6AIC1_9AGAM|nr:hypothetical protein BS47DRAFT_1400430 [Hydnum rufescens UP504]